MFSGGVPSSSPTPLDHDPHELPLAPYFPDEQISEELYGPIEKIGLVVAKNGGTGNILAALYQYQQPTTPLGSVLLGEPPPSLTNPWKRIGIFERITLKHITTGAKEVIEPCDYAVALQKYAVLKESIEAGLYYRKVKNITVLY